MGPRTTPNAVAKRKLPALAGNLSPVVQHEVAILTGLSRLLRRLCNVELGGKMIMNDEQEII
jgi:hypothetical protein